jgi:simple sugar transport system permease protein
VINTIMLNFIAVALVSYFTQYYYKIPGDPIMQTPRSARERHIPRISQYIHGMPEFVPAQHRVPSRDPYVLSRLLVSVEDEMGIRASRGSAENPSAAEYGGISPKKQIVIAMTISGGLAGMVAIGEVLGYRYRYYDGFSDGWGFLGIAVALLGRNHPLGIFIAAGVLRGSQTRRDLR